MKLNKIVFLGLIPALLSITACKKKEIDNEIESVIDFSIFQNELASITSIVQSEVQFKDGLKRISSTYLALNNQCPKDSLTGDTSGWYSGTYSNASNLPGLLLDWGTGCVSNVDLRNRTGKLKTSLTKPFQQNGCAVSINPMTYKFSLDNGSLLNFNGSFNLIRTSSNQFQVNGQNIILAEGSWSANFSMSENISCTYGMNDTLANNEIYEITGELNGINRTGKKFSALITSPLVKKSNYKWITSGKVELLPEGLEKRVIDFGNGAEDNLATFEINGSVFSFNLR